MPRRPVLMWLEWPLLFGASWPSDRHAPVPVTVQAADTVAGMSGFRMPPGQDSWLVQ
ncbi:hypothetical protein LHGZ1_3421 [Laribacter hongkongensis]|uniref:Uncharacterized protein n=1 Tax=Laribacter hongkongensis TaxID=168471 RepID=A0A248LNK9_9NEIS|nr:hypothetical protein LHGZ1_3421 [Laribacter hongkongensis]